MVMYTLIPALKKLRQKNLKFKASLSYTSRSCLKNQELGMQLSGRELA
jgi:hypothetical protein